MTLRETLKLIYKVGMVLATVGLAAGAFGAWWYSNPANGLLLVAGILAVLALIVGLSINKLEWQDEQADTYRGILDDMRSLVGNARTSRGPGGSMQFTFSAGAPLNVGYADPEVHRLDAEGLAEAKRMAAKGAPIDDICRMIDPAHDDHDEMHREMFRRLVRTMIEQG